MTVPEALAILELKIPVSEADIRKAFRSKARLYHPDKYTDPQLQQEASTRFIRAKSANDLLLSIKPELINTGRYRRDPVRATPRTRQPVYRKPPPIVQHPLVKEIDRVARLFHLINRQGKKSRLWKFISGIRFVPSEIIGSWYIRLIEKSFPGEEKLSGFLFFLFRFFRLLSGAVLLISGFFILSVLALSVMVVFAPPLLLFLGIYQVYISLISQVQKWMKQAGDATLPGIRSRHLLYLVLRSLPLIPWIAFAEIFVLFGLNFSFYVQSITWIFASLLFLLLCSIGSEWISYFRGKPLRP